MPRVTCGVAAATCLLLALPAGADPQDFQLYRLGNPSTTPDANANFRTFSKQLGCAISSVNLGPPETLGHSGYNLAFEYAVATVDTRAEVWPRAGRAEYGTRAPPSEALLMPSVHVRKGLPFSFEAGTRFAYIQYSRMATAGIDVKWALNEGFTYFPDLAVRGHATRLVGSREFGLTTAGVDLGLGKQFAIAGTVTLTPYAGWNIIYVNSSSSVIDFNPGRSPADAATRPTQDTGVFGQVIMPVNHSNRFYGGFRFISYVLELGAEVSGTQVVQGAWNMTYAAKLGLDF